MAENSTPSAIRESDYEALFGALTETERGRWFLDEYLKRNQKPETQVVLDAIGRLEKAMVRDRTVPNIDRIRLDIADMQEAIERTKREIANIKHEAEDGNRFSEASNELDAIVTKTEAATQEILAAAEAIQEHGWTLREAGADEATCDEIDARATEIFMACSFQDLTGQRTQKIVQVLQYLESRINLMISIWGIDDLEAKDLELRQDSRPDAHLLNGPQLEGRGVNQDAVDELFGPAETSEETSDEATTPETEAPDNAEGAADASPDLMADLTAEDIAAAAFAGETAGADEIDALFAGNDAFDQSDDDEDASDAASAEQTAEQEADVFAMDAIDDIDMVDAADAAASALADVTGITEADLLEADVFETPARAATEAADERKWQEDAANDGDATASDEDDASDDPLARLSEGERQSLFS